MRSVDVRTRSGDDVRPVDAAAFFTDELPGLVRDRGELALPGARELRPRPLAFEVDGRAWTLALGDGGPTVVRRRRRGHGRRPARCRRAPRPRQRPPHADGLLHRRRPRHAAPAGSRTSSTGAVILRSLLDGQPVHTAGAVTFHDLDGAPLDLRQGFAVDDDPEADLPLPRRSRVRAPPGRVHRGRRWRRSAPTWTRPAPGYAQGDGRSWWARTHAGEDRLVRMQYFQNESAATAALLACDRLQAHRRAHRRRPPARQAGGQHEPGRGAGEAASASSRGSPTCRGTRTARWAATRTGAAP